MKRFNKFFILIIFLFIGQQSFSQESTRINNLNKKLNTYLESISNEGEINKCKLTGSRRILIKGTIGNNSNRFRQSIKIFKSGLKRVKTSIYGRSLSFNFLIADITTLNDKIFYAKYFETKLANNKKYVRISEETIIDEDIYSRKDLETIP
jgi:hypothetical protein